MGLYIENVKRTMSKGTPFCPVKCKCGSNRVEARISKEAFSTEDEVGEGADWLELNCKRCGNTLYYNGA